ncbi:hypothetical protein BDN70DRAFT_871797 [Pholiota conissans]|uniref:DUF8205 domain-containing protein n=1 Tax=Pholiota conissans TaxID=109636 RepID=A0A9P6D6P0_9AGAR|nr:hypothetical protein BDN70DRAFT_871797 [Pholiota conissans]
MCRALMKAEEETPDPTGLEGIPGVVLFSLTDSTPEAAAVSQVPIIIQPDFLEIARAAEPFTQFFPSRRGIYLEKPMSVDSCIEHMNTVIRRDKNNRLLLRTEMTPTDEEIIRHSVTLNLKDTLTDTLINTLMKKKLLREYIYRVLMGTAEFPFD